jgi:hypothetical protein
MTFANVKVEPLIEEPVIAFEKVALTLVVRATPVAPFTGSTLLTVGAPGTAWLYP